LLRVVILRSIKKRVRLAPMKVQLTHD